MSKSLSNIDKHALREEFQYMQEIYSDPADRDRQAIYIAAEALLDELEVAIDACNGWQRKFAEADERLEAAEKRIVAQSGIIASARKFISEYAGFGDVGAAEFLAIIDRVAGTGKGE